MRKRKPSQEALALLEVVTAQSAALEAHGARLKKIEEWITHNMDQGLILPPWKSATPDT